MEPKTTVNEENSSQEKGIFMDERFQHLVSDPRFKRISKTQRKVKIDKRFQGMFTDERFHVKYTVDKYGRKVNKSNADDLRKYYDLESSSSESEDEKERNKEEKAISREAQNESAKSLDSEKLLDENVALTSDGEEVPKTLKERLLDPNIDYARGEGHLVTDSSSEDESSEDEDPELYIDHVWGELDNEAETTDESTKRLAVCNMDWDRIRAVDLLTLFTSFLPPTNRILSVKIYTSEYGKQRLAEEEVHGPQELVGLGKSVKSHQDTAEKSDGSVSEESDDELVHEQDSDAGEGDEYHMEKLRQYQLNRLRYYYAVVECDSVSTADKIYKECDGIEYESSATRVDLRFIPDDTTFDDDEPKDICTELPDMTTYKPRQFTTTALQQAKVDLTWDETTVERRELGEKLSSGKLENISDKDLRNIVAYSSEEDDEDDNEEDKEEGEDKEKVKTDDHSKLSENTPNATDVKTKAVKKTKKKEDSISKYKALLAEINENEKKERNKIFEMEFTWNVEESNNEKNEKDLESEKKAKPEMTPIERVMQKRNERNKRLKEERRRKKLLAKGIDPDTINSDGDLDSIPDDVDMTDAYFAEEFANGDFIEAKSKSKDKLKKGKKAKKTEEELKEDERKAKELELLLADDDPEDLVKQHFSLDKLLKAEDETKSKRKRRKQLKKTKSSIADDRKEIADNFEVNINDERFHAVYTSHHFNIDPTDAHFKKTKGMEKIIHEKLKRRYGNETESAVGKGKLKQEEEVDTGANELEVKRPKKQLENKLLIKNLKAHRIK